jgi:hypothetical protein
MRIRSNYGSVDQFLNAFVAQSEHRHYASGLATITEATLALLEMYTARRVGRSTYAAILAGFIEGDRQGIAQKTVGERAEVLGLLA